MKKTILYVPLILAITLTLSQTSNGDPRSQFIQRMCGHQIMHNSTIFIQNFVQTMENISDEQLGKENWGISNMGIGPDAAYGLVQCYGDLSLDDCVLCFTEARCLLVSGCFPNNRARIYLEGCFVRADNYSFFQENLGQEDTRVCGNDTQKDLLFQETTKRAIWQAVSNAPNNNGFAHIELPVLGRNIDNETTYVLANCWKTLNVNACKTCLESASSSMLKCLPWSEGHALYTGCFMRYSNNNFLNPIPNNEGSSRGNVVVIVVTILISLIVLIVGLAIGLYTWKQNRIEKKRKGSNDAERLVKTLHDSSLNFKYVTLEKATGSFDEANKIGQGGFGSVYKGVLADGREVVVKRLLLNQKHRASDFYNEVNIISCLEHKNLIRLLGCSCSDLESILVYEFLPNLSLDRFIFNQNKGKDLNWEKRFKIIVGIAEGLVYLHENPKTRIIHRDIKASNILLDSKFRAKIADFGLARSFQEDKSHISTAIAGTLGYMAPEYLVYGQLTEKADVYSFGVLLLEVVTGKQNNMSRNTEYMDNLVNIAWKHFQEGTIDELLDPNLTLKIMFSENAPDVTNEIIRVVHVGLLCSQEMPSLRPTMSNVLQMLVKKEGELPLPSNPPFINEEIMQSNTTWDSQICPLRQRDSTSNATMCHSSFYPR